MKKFFYFLPLAAVAFASCSSDEPLLNETPDTPEEIKVFDGDCAVVSINIMAAENSSRSRAENDPVSESNKNDYKFGSADENAVSSISFYFYDAAGDYVTKYSNATIANTDWVAGNLDNDRFVEKIGNAKIVLTDLLGTNYPSYVIAILNANPSGDTKTKLETSLTEAHKVLLGKEASWTVADNKAQNFIMTSVTSDENVADFHYFATPISEENFAIQTGNQGQDWPTNITPKPVDIYVERLAAKVEVKFSDKFTLAEDGSYLIKLPDTYSVDGEATDLYVKLQGWGLNGIEKTNYYFKHLPESNSFTTYDGWNFAGTHRCYWAVSPTYGWTEYPNSFGEVAEKAQDPSLIHANNEKLRYISWNDVKSNPFKAENFSYLPENTERAANTWIEATKTLNDAALSEVLIAGQITKVDGTPVEIYQLSESYYTKDGVIAYLLNAAGTHIWKKDSDEDNKYVTIQPSDVDINFGYDGTFSLKVTNKAVTYYEDNEGKKAYASTTAVADYINSFLPDRQSFAFIEGRLYYNIPIRHLRKIDNGIAKTGAYGVVRNHWYEVTITDVKKLGRAVYRPDEHIIPNTDDTRYMIGSSIKINSWRMVPQNVEL